jgi:hypothetical protein
MNDITHMDDASLNDVQGGRVEGGRPTGSIAAEQLRKVFTDSIEWMNESSIIISLSCHVDIIIIIGIA